MEIKLVDTVKNSANIVITVTKKDQLAEESHVLEELAQETTLKGFRKGKAPISLVKNSLDPEKIKSNLINHLLSHAIQNAVKTHNLKLIANPQLTDSQTNSDDWTFKLTLPLLPTIELGDYQEKIKKAKTKAAPKNEDQTLKVVFDTLLDAIKFDVPQSIIDDEVNKSLSRLVEQTQNLNLSVTDYLKSLKKTPEQLREEYQKTAEESLRLDFTLMAIAQDLKIKAEQAEVDELQKTSGLKPEQTEYLPAIIIKRKTVDSLLKL